MLSYDLGMAEKNTAAGVRAGHAKRGGARKGAGRPLGSPDKTPRKGSIKVTDRFSALQEELGKVYKERDDLKRQVGDLQFQLNYGKQFAGDSKALLTATYKAEYYPSQEQLYAAKTLLEKEYPSDAPGAQYDAGGKIIAYLPANGRDPDLYRDEVEAREWVQAQLRRQEREVHRQWDARLHRWIREGKLTEEQALLMRGLWHEDGDHEWQPIDTVKPERAPVQYIPPPVAEPKFTAPEPHPQPNGHANDLAMPAAGLIVLFARPFQCFQASSGHRYEAASDGSLFVDENEVDDIKDLQRSGCRNKR